MSPADHGSPPPRSATFKLAEGDRVVCDITNTAIAPRITLVKHVSAGDTGGVDPPQDWTLTAEGPRRDSEKSGSPEVTDVRVAAGTYTFEGDRTGRVHRVGLALWGGVLTGDKLFLALGYRATCTITNTAIPPRLTLVKHVDNNAGGRAGPDAWTLTAAGR
jgi:large repetitive protein